MSSEELRLFDKVRVYLDEDYSSAENFTVGINYHNVPIKLPFMCVCVCTRMCVCVCVCVHSCAHTSTWAHVHACTGVCPYLLWKHMFCPSCCC